MIKCWLLQYLARIIRPGKNIFDRFAVLFTVIIVWIYAHLLTVGGAYNGKPPKTQASCRTDRAGLIDGAPWQVLLSDIFHFSNVTGMRLNIYVDTHGNFVVFYLYICGPKDIELLGKNYDFVSVRVGNASITTINSKGFYSMVFKLCSREVAHSHGIKWKVRCLCLGDKD